MTAAASIAAIVGGGIGAYGSLEAGSAAAKAAKYNAAVARQNADIALQQADMDAAAQQRAAAKVIGGERAAYGASGVSGGSVSDVIRASEITSELDRQNILYGGKLKAMGYQQTSAMETMGAKQDIIGSRYQAASQLLTGAGSAASSAPSSATANIKN